MDTVANLAGFSPTVRLVFKVIGAVVALPVAFYLVERYFLSRSRKNQY